MIKLEIAGFALALLAAVYTVLALQVKSGNPRKVWRLIRENKSTIKDINIVIAGAVLFALATSLWAAERRGTLALGLDHPFSGYSDQCVHKGDQTASNILGTYALWKLGPHGAGPAAAHESCAGNDDATGKSKDLVGAFYGYTRGAWGLKLVYMNDKRLYGTVGYTVYALDRLSFEPFIHASPSEETFGLNINWKFELKL